MPQLQFDTGSWVTEALCRSRAFSWEQISSSGAIHAMTVPDPKKTGMPYVVVATAKWVRDLGYSQHTENQRHELQPVDFRSFDVR